MYASLRDAPRVGLGAREDAATLHPLRPAAPQVWLHGCRGPALFPPGRPAFFTADRAAAARQAERCPHRWGEPRVHEALLDIRRPAGYYDLLRAVRRARAGDADLTRHAPEVGGREIGYLLVPKVRAALARAGHDGYLGWDALEGREIPVAVTFRPEQVVPLPPRDDAPLAA